MGPSPSPSSWQRGAGQRAGRRESQRWRSARLGQDLRLTQGPARRGRGSCLQQRDGALGRPSSWWSSEPSSKTRWLGSPEILDTPASGVPAKEGKQTPLPPLYHWMLILPENGEDWFTWVVKLSLSEGFSVNVGTVRPLRSRTGPSQAVSSAGTRSCIRLGKRRNQKQPGGLAPGRGVRCERAPSSPPCGLPSGLG